MLICFNFEAGIASADNPEQLLIALEPECASAYCREKKMRDFSSKRGDASVSDVFARPGSRYLVIDIGGNDFFLLKITKMRLRLPFIQICQEYSLKSNGTIAFEYVGWKSRYK